MEWLSKIVYKIPKRRDANLTSKTEKIKPHSKETWKTVWQKKKKTRMSNLLNLEFSGKAFGDSVDEVGKWERSTTISVGETNTDITDN